MSEAETKHDFGKMARYVQDIADQQNSEERMNLGKIADVLHGLDKLTTPQRASGASVGLMVSDPKTQRAVMWPADWASVIVEVGGASYAEFQAPPDFYVLHEEQFKALGTADPDANVAPQHGIILVSDGNGAIVPAEYQGLDEDDVPIFQITAPLVREAVDDAGGEANPTANTSPPADTKPPEAHDERKEKPPEEKLPEPEEQKRAMTREELLSMPDPAGSGKTIGEAFGLSEPQDKPEGG